MKRTTMYYIQLLMLPTLLLFPLNAQDLCSLEVISALELGGAEVISCETFHKKKKKTTEMIAALLIYPDSNNEVRNATFSIYRFHKKKKDKLELLYLKSNLGETFLPFKYHGTDTIFTIADVNQDGAIDFLFMYDDFSTTRLNILTIDTKKKSLVPIGFFTVYEKKLEFYPFFTGHLGKDVEVLPGAIKTHGKEGIRNFKLDGLHFRED